MQKKFDPYKCSLLLLIYILKDLIETGNFICLCILVHSSRKNPFETHYIGNISNYFYSELNIKTINKNKYNNTLFNIVNRENHILNGKENISSDIDIKKFFLRKLVSRSFCSEIHDDFEKFRGTKLSNIFDLNYGKIHKISIATLVIYCVTIVLGYVNCGLLAKGVYGKKEYLCFTNTYNFILLLFIVAKYILSIIWI